MSVISLYKSAITNTVIRREPVLPVPTFGERERRRQRYYKKVGTVEEYYIMDANLAAGVFSGTGTGYEPDYWNILGHGVEGSYFSDGTKRY